MTTAGRGVRDRVEAWKRAGEYLRSPRARRAGDRVGGGCGRADPPAAARAAWGFPDPEELEPRDLFAARYRGKRYSFGYPACPDLAGQRQLFEALDPGEIGVELTEGDMMDPEASVSALVVHHPDARYFGV